MGLESPFTIFSYIATICGSAASNFSLPLIITSSVFTGGKLGGEKLTASAIICNISSGTGVFLNTRTDLRVCSKHRNASLLLVALGKSKKIALQV